MAEPGRLPELIDRYLNGVASSDELRELGEALAADAQAADQFWAAAELDSLIGEHFRLEPHRLEIEQHVAVINKRPGLPRAAWGLIAASLLIAIGMFARWQSDVDSPRQYDVLSGRVLVDGSQTGRIIEGAPVVVWGETPAVIRLPDGSQAQLDPQSEVVVRNSREASPQIVELLHGSGSFHVPKGEPLRVETAVGNVTSTDTEFSIDYVRSQPEGDEPLRAFPTSIAALVVTVVTGIVQVDVQDQSFKVSSGESRVFAAAPSQGKGKKGPLPLPAGDLLGFQVNGKTSSLEKVYPGIRSALMLTEDQKMQILIAQIETVQSKAVRAAVDSIKSKPGANTEDLAKAKEIATAARKQLLEKMATILTAEQKELVKKLNTAATESQKAVFESFRDDMKNAKKDKAKFEEAQQRMREPLIAEFKSRAAKFLSPEQIAAMEKGVEEQKAADERAKLNPKPSKASKP